MGMLLVERLRRAGLTFKVLEDGQAGAPAAAGAKQEAAAAQ